VRNIRSVLERVKLPWLLVALLVVCVSDPFGILNGAYSEDSYSQMRSELKKTKNPIVLPVGSWNDFYSLEYNDYWRKEVGGEFVERTYGEVLDAASLGDDFFNQYLHAKGVTHILVPLSTYENGAISHKFGSRGSIEIQLASPYFTFVMTSNGPYPAALLKVGKEIVAEVDTTNSSYEINWKNTDWWFYTKRTKFAEVGLYNYSFSDFYEWGPDVSWFFDLSPERSNVLEVAFTSTSANLNQVNVQLVLVSAYGPNAPEHVISVKTNKYDETKTLSPNNPGVFTFKLQAGESAKIFNVTPCRLPSDFEPTDLSINKICFGVSKLFISPETQAE
jgi:hypothetical protein